MSVPIFFYITYSLNGRTDFDVHSIRTHLHQYFFLIIYIWKDIKYFVYCKYCVY